MKKNLKFSIGLLVLVLTLVTTVFVSKTLARYNTEISGSATASVASWAFEADETSYDAASSTALSVTLTGSGKESKIVPGDSGTFNIYIDATGSDVAADYQVSFSAIPTGITLKLGSAAGEAITTSNFVVGSLKQGETMQATVVVYWVYDVTTEAPITWSNITFGITGQQGTATTDAAAAVSTTTNIE